jgi:ABC-type branched-subunit amino acid transport system permease subunit
LLLTSTSSIEHFFVNSSTEAAGQHDMECTTVFRRSSAMHQLGFDLVAGIAIALIALPLAIVFTLALNRLFRSRVGRSMGSTGSTAVDPEIYQPSPKTPQGELYDFAIDQVH